MESTDYSRIYRIMHWAMAATFIFLLLTIFLRLTWMNKYNVSAIIQDYLHTTDQQLSQDQTIALAKKIRKPMWDWHIYSGYVLLGLFIIRLSLPFFGQMRFRSPLLKNQSAKIKFQRWSYLIFYILVATSLITGLVIVWGPKEYKEIMEEIHVLGIYYLLAFILLHVGGVLWSEFTSDAGIVSRIVSGRNKPPKID